MSEITVDTPIISVVFPNTRISSTDPDTPPEPKWDDPGYPFIKSIKEVESSTGLNFLSNLSLSNEELKQIKEQKYSGATKWENFPSATNILKSNLQAIEDSEKLTKRGLFQNSPAQIYPRQISSIYQGISQQSFVQDSIRQVSINERSFDQIGSRQVSVAQIDSFQNTFSQTSPTKIGSTKIGSTKIGSVQTSSSEVGTTEVSTTEVSTQKNNFGEIGIAQVNSRKIAASSKFNSSQINSREVSFPSSIPSEQLFSSHSQIHNSTPQIINELNNSATNIWSDLLQPETQLDINFQITDLPTGQLAEATITGFDSSGKPNSGIILIDHDANGVGWFIDETPLDNSEFINQNLASYFLADPESAANGKYDLLTTVLHELAHLYGFIDGYAGFEQLKTENTLVGDNFTATLDGEHLDRQAHPRDLLNTHLAPGIRKLPSELDVQILKTILATEESPQPLPNPLLVGEGTDEVPPSIGYRVYISLLCFISKIFAP